VQNTQAWRDNPRAPRVAAARGLPEAQVEAPVQASAFAPGEFLTSDRLVNVLELNLALDRLAGSR